MVVILVHWLIKKEFQDKFIQTWKEMTIAQGQGLYREVLTQADPSIGPPMLHTFSLENAHYETFINIGIWESVKAFENAVAKYIVKPLENNDKVLIELKDFEFKMRERIVLKVITDRGTALPPADLII